MSKKATVNGFTEGLSMDLNELTDTKETLIDALNATLVTGNGNEMILQNDDGNVKIAYKEDDTIKYAALAPGFVPIGIKEFGGIIYIASINPDPKNYNCELGTFPSPEYTKDDNNQLASKGKITYQYRPLNNCINESEQVAIFRTKYLNFDLKHPVTIDIQKSYDNSVNLIINDGNNIPRLINSGFAVTSQNDYEIPKRTDDTTQKYKLSDQKTFDIVTSLVKRYNKIPKIKFNGVLNGGNMKVGNYVFYFKYADADDNETDIIAESGIVSCFQGNNADPSTINGGFRDNNSNKSVSFTLSNLDKGFQYIKVSYSRNTSDVDQNRVTSVVNINYKFQISNQECNIIINGNEKTNSSTIEELNQQYTILNSIKTETQNSNILFSANVSVDKIPYQELTNISQHILPYVYSKDSKSVIGEIDDSNYSDISNITEDNELHHYSGEYYNVKNIYYNLGYWPEEFYRFGIVYIFNDGSLSPVFNVRGCDTLPNLTYGTSGNPYYKSVTDNYVNIDDKTISIKHNIYYQNDKITKNFQNNKGVVRIKRDENKTVRQLYGIGFYADNKVKEELGKYNIKGYFYVRQKRIPTILCQAYLMPNDTNSTLPYIYRLRYTDENTDESPKSPFYCNSGNSLDVKRYKLGLVGESFLWYSGETEDYEFKFKTDPTTYYIKMPTGIVRVGNGTQKYIRKGDTIDGLAQYTNMTIDDENGIIRYYLEIFSDDIKSTETEHFPENKDFYGTTFTIETHTDNTHKFEYKYQASTKDGDGNYIFPAWKYDALSYFNGTNDTKDNKSYEQYLDYEGRLFYFPLYDPNSDYIGGKSSYYKHFQYERYVNRQHRWSAYSPDFMIKQPYYNQFFTGGKLKARVADISTPHYPAIGITTRVPDSGTEQAKYYIYTDGWKGAKLDNSSILNYINNTHKFLQQEGNYSNGKFRQYHIGNDNLEQLVGTDIYEDIYCVSLTDTSTIGSTTDSKQSIFRSTAGSAQEALRCRQYYSDLTDNDKKDGQIDAQPYSGDDKSTSLINKNIVINGHNLFSNDNEKRDLFNTSPVVRGIYSPYIGITTDITKEEDTDRYELSEDKDKNTIPSYIGVGEIINIYIPGFKSEINSYKFDVNGELTENGTTVQLLESAIYQYLSIRMHDTSAYFAVSDRLNLENITDTVCYRGDCYFSTYTQRINRNFQDPSAPTNDIVVDNETWQSHGIGSKDSEHKINSGDVNAAPLGNWITFKCCTNYNLSIRSKDDSNTAENALTGQSRSFYPLSSPDMSASSKIPESETMNDGFNTTVGDKQYFTIEDSQYIKNSFNNRIYYSNVSQEGSFKNGYRIIKSNNFRDYNPEYGSITKILPYNDNLLVIFEHGVGVCQIYEKNLITQDSNSQVFINSNNILPLKLTILSDTIGSQWPESIIKTPYFIYGVDTSAKKIWKLNDNQVEIISDFKVESFLNKNIDITSKDFNPYLGVRNVKSHYNATKNEVMFTYYNNSNIYNNGLTDNNKNDYIQWNLAYNEINKCFTTFYSWIPSYSENIDNIFYSFDNYPLIHTKLYPSEEWKVSYIYKHGLLDPINDKLQELPKPCFWYDRQEPFEFEFTVRDDPSVQKIWNNLQIISNKAEPQSFHFEVTGDSYEFKKDKPNMYYRQEATKELWHNLGSTIKYDKDYTKHATPNYEYTILNRYTTESPYLTIGGVSKSTYFPLYYKRYKQGLEIKYSVNSATDFTHQKNWDWRYLSGSEILYDDKTNQFNIGTHIQCIPRSKYGTLRCNCDYVEDKWEVQIPLINMVQKNEDKWDIPPIIIDYIPADLKSSEIDFNVLPKDYKQLDYWPKGLDLNKWTATKQMPIRDKYIKIRVRYDGTQKAIISAIKTIYTESFA